jgi:hypothetical protein
MMPCVTRNDENTIVPGWRSLYWSPAGAAPRVPPSFRGGWCRHWDGLFSEQYPLLLTPRVSSPLRGPARRGVAADRAAWKLEGHTVDEIAARLLDPAPRLTCRSPRPTSNVAGRRRRTVMVQKDPTGTRPFPPLRGSFVCALSEPERPADRSSEPAHAVPGHSAEVRAGSGDRPITL